METQLKLLCLWVWICITSVSCSLNSDPLQLIDDPSISPTIPNSGLMTSYSNEDYQALSPLVQYRLTNTLATSLFKGIPADDFFDFTNGTASLQLKSSDNGLAQIYDALQNYDPNLLQTYHDTNIKYFTDADQQLRFAPLEEPLVFLFELPLSRDYFDLWMAYQLSNTILFSPALELKSVEPIDGHKVINRLNESIKQDMSIRDIVYRHMTSQENWRRFRSPEDNTREMMEIYLGHFQDEDVPKAATACQNWSLSDEAQGYRLIRSLNINNEPQTLLGANHIKTCEDFYRTLADHINLTPTVTLQIVNAFFPYQSSSIRAQITNAILKTDPQTFRDIFTVILFSHYFLAQNPRIKRIEETFFNLANRIDWKSSPRFFTYLTKSDPTAPPVRINLLQISQEPLTYKLGRPNQAPIDTLSFSYYHGLIRNSLLLDTPINDLAAGWQISFFERNAIKNLTPSQYIDYVFISTISRKPTDTEHTALLDIITRTKNTLLKVSQTKIIFDYIANIPELYYIDNLD